MNFCPCCRRHVGEDLIKVIWGEPPNEQIHKVCADCAVGWHLAKEDE